MSDDEENWSPEAEGAMQTALSVLGAKSQLGVAQPELRQISRRDSIPIPEKHILVMWGLSTYRFDHPLGVTFVVSNSRANRESEQQFRDALAAARNLAQDHGLPCVYVLD